MYLAHGQDPFLLALALTVGGVAVLARGWWLPAALLVAVAVYANPMAFVVRGLLMLADVLGRPECRRRYLRFFAVLAPFVLVRLLLGWAFSEPSAYLNETSQLMLYLGFALAGLALAGVNAAHPRRPFLILFVTYSAICVLSFVTPGSPLGNNIGRFFRVFGLPLLLLLLQHAAEAALPIRGSRGHPHRPLRSAAGERPVQPLHADRRAAAGARLVLRAGPCGGGAVL